MALRPITEQLATRFGLIAGVLKAPLPAFDALFDQVFGPAFKTAARWEDTIALLRARMLDPYFAYLNRVYPRGSRPGPAPIPSDRPLRIGYFCWSYECGGSFAIGRVLYSILHGHALLGQATSETFLYAQARCSAETQALFGALPGLTVRDFSPAARPGSRRRGDRRRSARCDRDRGLQFFRLPHGPSPHDNRSSSTCRSDCIRFRLRFLTAI